MSAGQKLLADLLGITNSAAESLSIQQVKDLEATTRETRGNDSKEQAEAPKMEGDDFDWLVGTTKKMGERMMQEDDLQSSKSLLSGSLEDEFDESRCIKVKVPANLLKEKLSASDTSVNSMLNSAESSVERQPIPEPSDFVRPGVFVSSAQKDVRQSTTNHSIGTKQRSKEHENKKHLQLVKRMREHPQILNSVGLLQGKENSMEQTCDAQPHKENEVVVLQFEQGTKKSDVQEKFKSRMSSAPIKKRVIPNIVAPSRETHPSQSAKLDAGQSSIADTKSVGQPQNTADQAVQYAALATSAAIAPFLQIQNALENQIASLVSTMSLAHSAEGNMKMTTQEDRLRELEDKIIDVLDKRMARIENVKDHATQRKMNATNEKKVPVSHGNEEFTFKQKLGNSGIAGELDHLRFKSAEPTSGHSVPVMLHDGPDNGYPDVARYGATRSPSGLTSFDNDLQLIPTRDDQLVRKDTSGRTLHRQQNPILDPDIRHPLLKSCHSQPNMIPRSYPTLSHASDKALSPFSRRTKMQTNAVSPFLRNAKTQTSSSESSLVSEKSLLETPLPRSKIPVPFSRYTPKSEKGSRHEKRKVVTSLRNENQLLKGILKQSEEPRILDKENISPKTSSPKRIQGVPSRQMAKDNVSLERQGQNPEDIIRIARDRDLINEVSQKALEKEDIVRGIAPIDHYLTFPLRGNYSQFKDIPPTSTVKSIQRSGTVSKDDEGQTIKGESIKAESTRGHYVAASRVLSEIQERRNRLECNLDTLVRQRDQNRLYEYIDQHGSNQSDDIQRIRQEVDKKIEEISAQLQRETIAPVKEIPKMPEKVENQKKLSVKPNTRFPARGARQKIDNKSDTGKKSTKLKKKLEGKEKTKKKGTAQKPESALGSQLQDAITPTSYDPDLLAAIFGQRVHDHHRSTVRPPHIQFHSPSKVSSTPSRPQYTQEPQDVRRTTSPIYETKDDRGAKGAKQTKYYFQPSDPHYGDEAARINYPSSGELVPVAQPLGKPRQDSKFRLAIPSTERPQTRHVGKTNGNIDTQSNIAVIEIKADEPRTPDWKKKAERLAIQNLPSLDIQTPPKQEENDRESDSGNKRISLTPPKQEDYDGFQNYIACDDVIAPNEHESGSEAELGLEFRGQDFGKPREYNEPRFPPERPPCEMESKPATAEIQCKTSLEERAQEWVEQELLARIVNKMNVPQDPTIFRPHDGSIQSQSSSESSDEEEHD